MRTTSNINRERRELIRFFILIAALIAGGTWFMAHVSFHFR